MANPFGLTWTDASGIAAELEARGYPMVETQQCDDDPDRAYISYGGPRCGKMFLFDTAALDSIPPYATIIPDWDEDTGELARVALDGRVPELFTSDVAKIAGVANDYREALEHEDSPTRREVLLSDFRARIAVIFQEAA